MKLEIVDKFDNSQALSPMKNLKEKVICKFL